MHSFSLLIAADNSGDPRIAYSNNTLKLFMVLSLQINAKLIILLLQTPHFQSQFLCVLSLQIDYVLSL